MGRVRRRVAFLARIALDLLVCAIAIDLAAAEPVSASSPVVVLTRVQVPEGLEDPEPLAAKIETEVTAFLRAGGFEVVSSSEFGAVWQRRVREANGYFDTVSGRPDLIKRRALRVAALRELQDRFDAQALLQADLVVVAADYAKGKAVWDGAKETAAPSGSGVVPALSLAVRVEDLAGRETGAARAGIQLLAKYSVWNGKYGPVPRDKLLADEKELDDAVSRALNPVLEALRSAPVAVETVELPESAAPVATAAVDIEAPPADAKVAALRALLVPEPEVEVPDEVEARYTEALRARLEATGWWVLPADAFEQTLRAIVLERGGLYDPITGKGDPEESEATVREARRRVAERYGASVVVSCGIFVRSASFSGERASWDGVSSQVGDIAGWKKLLVTTHGKARALSFGVLVEDVDGSVRHVGWGGIELLDRIEHNRFVHVPPEALFANPERDLRAVELALGDWLGDGRTSSTEQAP